MKPNGIKKIKKRTEINKEKAIEMYREDFSLRQIQKELKYKSVSSVQYLLKDEKKKNNSD